MTQHGPRTLIIDCDQLGNDISLDPSNRDGVALLLSSWLALLHDSPLPSKDRRRPLQVYKRFLSSFYTESGGLRSRVAYYADLRAKLLGALQTECDPSELFSAFKGTPVFREFYSFWKTRNPALLKFLLSFLGFGNKAEYEDEELHATAFRDWLRVEEKLSCLQLPEYLGDLKVVIDQLLRYRQPLYFMGKHGSGSVADGTRNLDWKLLHFQFGSQHERFYSEVLPKSGAAEAVMLSYTGEYHRPYRENSFQTQRAELEFVVKDVRKSRSICKEPLPTMYQQQHVLYTMVDGLTHSPLGRYVTINDQTRNQKGAIYGSLTGRVDTLDLSSASDSVSYRLVKEIFPQPWLSFLESTRTSEVLCPDGSVRVLEKFAPMGSAVCFPTQCVIFSAVIVYAMLVRSFGWTEATLRLLDPKFSVDRWLRANVQGEWGSVGLYEHFSVYGDDIICDNRVTDYVIAILTELGFEVNTRKSFFGSHPVRESCGVYAFDGVDVTPLVYKGKTIKGALGPGPLQNLYEFCNLCYDFRYYNLRRHLIAYLMGWCPPRGESENPILFSDRREDQAVYTPNPRNTHLKRRYNVDLQRDEVRAWCVASKDVIHAHGDKMTSNKKLLSMWDSYELHMYYRSIALGRSDDDYVIPRVIQKGSRLSRNWYPA